MPSPFLASHIPRPLPSPPLPPSRVRVQGPGFPHSHRCTGGRTDCCTAGSGRRARGSGGPEAVGRQAAGGAERGAGGGSGGSGTGSGGEGELGGGEAERVRRRPEGVCVGKLRGGDCAAGGAERGAGIGCGREGEEAQLEGVRVRASGEAGNWAADSGRSGVRSALASRHAAHSLAAPPG